MSYKSSPRGSSPVRWVTVHTAEGSRTKESLGSFFYSPSTMASSHVGIDGRGILQYVSYDRAAWTLRNGNPISDNAELCGFARWNRNQWFSTGTIDGVYNPAAMLDYTAKWVRSRCIARLIPIRHLAPSQLGQAGVIGHWDYTRYSGDGTHTDPGVNFPWDYVIGKAAGAPMSDAEVVQIKRMLWAGGDVPGSVAAGTLIDVAREIRSMLWAGGPVEGSVAGGTLISDVRGLKTDVAVLKSQLNTILAKLNDLA